MRIIKNLLPHFVAVLLFFGISLAMFTPLIEGKKIQQHDILMFKGMSKEISDYRAKTNSEPLWTNSMFGGMPAYQISVVYKNNIAQYFNRFISLDLDVPANILFISLTGFYFLLIVFRLDPWMSFAGAMAFGLSSYFFIIEAAGHNSKAYSMALMAPVVAGFILTLRGKYLTGGILTALFLSLQLNANHLQIFYYTGFILLLLLMTTFLSTFVEKTWDKYLKALGCLVLAMILSIGVNFSNLYLTNEYGKASTRGKSDLSLKTADNTSGLDRSYILDDYSYGIAETGNLFIPNFMGGPSSGSLGMNSETYNYFLSVNINPEKAKSYAAAMPLYWGEQRFTSGPVYLGAVVIFLFVLGLFAMKGPVKWWLVAATILSIMLAWGRNMEFLSDWFIDYFPGYNKFRTVSMILVIACFTVPLLGILGLKNMVDKGIPDATKKKYLYYTLAITGGISLLFALVPQLFFQFNAPEDSALKLPIAFAKALQDDRRSLMQTDAFRTFVFILLSTGVVYSFLIQKLSLKMTCASFAFLFITDLGFVGKRYLDDTQFAPKHIAEIPFEASKADSVILKDSQPDFRVANISLDLFNDASTSYFHHSIGGYHGAKLRRYQDIIDFYLYNEVQQVKSIARMFPSHERLDSLFVKKPVINMLNTKYIIYNPDTSPILNSHAFGNAWFVSSILPVVNADEELMSLKSIDPKQIAIVDKKFNTLYRKDDKIQSTSGIISLVSYAPNRLVYTSKADGNRIAVFSEIYYEKGWNAYMDGKKVSYFRADYILRSMMVPKGSHIIEFRFEPDSYYLGEKVSMMSSCMLVLLLISLAVYQITNQVQKKPTHL